MDDENTFRIGGVTGNDVKTTTLVAGPFSTWTRQVFDPSKEIFPHVAGWCDGQGIEHNWRHPYAHSFTGPQPDTHRRYCVNCGQQQSRTPPQTIPAGQWTDEAPKTDQQ